MSDSERSAVPISPAAARQAAWALYLTAFTSGGVLMGVEIAGSRVMAPAFGTSIFVWGSLIGLFMGAMALGYYVGGSLADWKPSFAVLATIVSLAGLYTFCFIPYLGYPLCGLIGISVPHRAFGPLLAAFVLFFVPSFLMAMVSPFAIKLNARSLAGVGGVAGKLYAISTAGSIVGTLLTTFALIPLFRTTNVLQGLGLTLIVLAVVALLLFKKAVGGVSAADRSGAAMMALIALGCLEAWVIWPVQPPVPRGERLLYYEESSYHDIAVSEEVVDAWGGVKDPADVRRWLKFNENHESGIYPYLGTYKNAVQYTDVVHLCMLWAPQPKRLLVVGGGGAVLPTQFRQHYPSIERADVLELDQVVVDVAKSHFQADPGITYYVGDARKNLERMDCVYDIIMLDAYSSGGQIPFHLVTWEFLRQVKQKLAPRGVLVSNIIAAVENDNPPRERPADIYLAEVRTLLANEAEALRVANPTAEQQKPLFKNLYIFPKFRDEKDARTNLTEYRNVLMFANDWEETKKTHAQIVREADTFIEGRPVGRRVDPGQFRWHARNMLTRNYPSSEILAALPVLTDDYAPVDTMYRPVKWDEAVWRGY